MLIAQAEERNMVLVSKDAEFNGYGVNRLGDPAHIDAGTTLGTRTAHTSHLTYAKVDVCCRRARWRHVLRVADFARAQYPCLVSVNPAIAHAGGLSFANSAAG